MTTDTLDRVGIRSLDQAFYVASCFAASAPDRVVTIMEAVDASREEVYWVADGRRVGWEETGPLGLAYGACYYVERPPHA